jgi:hypothetical protein
MQAQIEPLYYFIYSVCDIYDQAMQRNTCSRMQPQRIIHPMSTFFFSQIVSQILRVRKEHAPNAHWKRQTCVGPVFS